MSRALDHAFLAFPLVFTAALWAGAIGSFAFIPVVPEPEPEELRPVTMILPPLAVDEPAVAEAAEAPEPRPAVEAPALPIVSDPAGTVAVSRPGAPARQERVEDEDASRKGKGKKNRCNRTSPDITPVSENHWKIESDLVAYHTASIDRLMALGWSRPYDEQGQKGIYVSGFGCTSDPYLGGFRRGDVVQSVNGKKTNNFLQVWFAWQKVKKDEHFEVVVLREGRRLLLTYDMV
jgi:hypothetical protein